MRRIMTLGWFPLLMAGGLIDEEEVGSGMLKLQQLFRSSLSTECRLHYVSKHIFLTGSAHWQFGAGDDPLAARLEVAYYYYYYYYFHIWRWGLSTTAPRIWTRAFVFSIGGYFDCSSSMSCNELANFLCTLIYKYSNFKFQSMLCVLSLQMCTGVFGVNEDIPWNNVSDTLETLMFSK